MSNLQVYRSKRFPHGDLAGLGQVWSEIDRLETDWLGVRTEIMAGTSYRRQLDPDNPEEYAGVNYLLQTVLTVPKPEEGKRITARYYVDEARRILGGLDLPGEPEIDPGGLHGLDPSTTKLAFGSTGDTDKDLLYIFPPWLSTRWREAGKDCMFLCGIDPPQPRGLYEEHPVPWSIGDMRRGHVVFKPTPSGLKTW